jgi:hypothetical protein
VVPGGAVAPPQLRAAATATAGALRKRDRRRVANGGGCQAKTRAVRDLAGRAVRPPIGRRRLHEVDAKFQVYDATRGSAFVR